MLLLLEKSMWLRDQTDEGHRTDVTIPSGTQYLTLSGRDWEGASASLAVAGQSMQAIRLVQIGSETYGTAVIRSLAGHASLKLKADDCPAEIAIGSYSHPYPSDRWRRVLPACLNHSPSAAQAVSDHDPGDMTKPYGDEPLSASIAEIAANCLSGSRAGIAVQSAVLLLHHLATHPMDRSPGLGAFVAALCQKESVL